MITGTRAIDYLGDLDVTEWLEATNKGEPVIFPLWPKNPAHVPIGATRDGCLVVALSRDALYSARRPDFLWFCHMDKEAVLRDTDAHASWFQGDST